MSDLLSQVTPLTRGIIWLTSLDSIQENSHYKEIDYLLNGLLTATFNTSPLKDSQILVAENFGHSFYVFIGQDLTSDKMSNFFTLVKPHLTGEHDLLLIDESGNSDRIEKLMSKELSNRLRNIK